MYKPALRLALLLAAAAPAALPAQPANRAAQPEQRAALDAFKRLDGVWSGPATSMTATGEHKITQTERVGPMLGGAVRLIEGRSTDAAGGSPFQALAVISFDERRQAYEIRSYAQGLAGTFPIRPTADGYVWETPAGPGATIRYTATIGATTWDQIGERIATGQPPRRIFEMHLTRQGDTDWPEGAATPR